MTNFIILTFVSLLLFSNCLEIVTKDDDYKPEWDSLDSRPLPQWYDDAKIGIFIHWGVYAVPSMGTEWFWSNWKGSIPEYVKYMKNNFPPGFTYQDFGPHFTAEQFSPDFWADLFKSAGAKYVVLTSKHHDGYCLWPSKYCYSWNSQDVGAHRDLIGELATAIRNRTDLKFGLYHSLYEWFNPLYLNDKKSKWVEKDFVRSKTMPELHELVETYKPEIVWSDGEWEAPDTYWESKAFLAWLYNLSPVRETVVANDRWGSGTLCKHGDFYTCTDRYNPGVLIKHKWENAMTIDKKSWGYRLNANLDEYMSIEELIDTVATTVSCGGNILINVGPTKEGMIIPIFQERLSQLGEWLSINGEAIYQSRPWTIQNDTVTSGVWYTQRPDLSAVYAIFLNWPQSEILNLTNDPTLFTDKTDVYLVNKNDNIRLDVRTAQDHVEIMLPNKMKAESQWGWTLKIIK